MVSSTLQAIACILVIISGAVFAQSQTTPSKESTGTITGKITIKGKGAPDVVVSLYLNESSYTRQPANHRGVTDSEGNYRLINVPPGRYTISALAPAYVSVEEEPGRRHLVVNKGETIEHCDFTLVRGAVITGKVVDSDGRPVIEQEVFLFNSRDNTRVYQAWWNGRTDDRGVYRMFGLKPGSYKVAAGTSPDNAVHGPMWGAIYTQTYHPGVNDPSQATTIEVSEGSEATNVDITLANRLTTYSASGRIVDRETGRSMPNVNYGVTHFVNPNNTASMSTGAVSNARGEFKLDNLVPGKYAVFIRPQPEDDWHAEEVRFEVIDQNITGLVVRTAKGASLSGVMVLEGTDDKAAREQFSRLSLIASVEPGPRGSGRSTTLKPDGSFHITGLPAGRVFFFFPNQTRFRIVRVEREGVGQVRGLELADGQHVSGLRLVVNYGDGSVRGAIEIEKGTLPPDARFFVWLKKLDEDPSLRSSSSDVAPQVDARGQFLAEGVMPGTYEVNGGVWIEQTRTVYHVTKQQIVVTAGATTNITLKLDLNNPQVRP